jgi:hypothetical protein
VKNLILFLVFASTFVLLTSCSSGTSPMAPPPVLAQTGYTNASLNGTYSVSLTSSFVPSGLPFFSGIGSIQLNGAGSVIGGTINIYFSAATAPCVYSSTGTYSLQSTALGTATLNLTSSTKNCAPADTWQLALAAADGGVAVQFVRTDGSVLSGSAVKQ